MKACSSFHEPLHKTNKGIGAIYQFYGPAENEFEIRLPFTEPTLALILNLSDCSDTYRLNGKEGKLFNGYFNLFNLPVGTCQWTLREGMYWFLVVTCPYKFLNDCRQDYPMIARFLDNKSSHGSLLNPSGYMALPSMFNRLDTLLSYVGTHGPLREMQLSCTAAELLFDALKCSDLHHRNEIDDTTMRELDRVYRYMVRHLVDITDSSDLIALTSLPEERFHQAFELVYQNTLPEMMHRERMTRAIMLLENTDIDLLYISGRAGFPSLNDFIDAFFERYDMGPDTFRERYGNPLPPQNLF